MGRQRQRERQRERKETARIKRKKTRPDTRLPVADGWAGAEMRVFPLFNSSVTDRPTNQPTDGWTDKASFRVACPQLKNKDKAGHTATLVEISCRWVGM